MKEKLSKNILLNITPTMKNQLNFCEKHGYPINATVIRQAIQSLIDKRLSLIGAENE